MTLIVLHTLNIFHSRYQAQLLIQNKITDSTFFSAQVVLGILPYALPNIHQQFRCNTNLYVYSHPSNTFLVALNFLTTSHCSMIIAITQDLGQHANQPLCHTLKVCPCLIQFKSDAEILGRSHDFTGICSIIIKETERTYSPKLDMFISISFGP